MKIYDYKEECTGCGACVNVCPNHCISLQFDEEGFLYPVVNEDACIHCNLCITRCHMKRTYLKKEQGEATFYAAYCKKGVIVSRSSSGGVFSALAYGVIKQHGVVYGVVQENLFEVRHQRAETLQECKKFRKSKYLESNTYDTFQEVKRDLKAGRCVLFSGTGCQIAGLYGYLNNKEYNLITCEVVCHGVPSMKVFEKYIAELEYKYHAKVSEICFRDKRRGWIPNYETISFQNGKRITSESGNNPFHRGFLNGLYSRPSCGGCRYAKLPRVADITLADYWGYSGKIRKTNQNKGISLVVLSSENGKKLFEKTSALLVTDQSRFRDAVKSCYHLTHMPHQSINRNTFLRKIDNLPFWYLIKKYSK